MVRLGSNMRGGAETGGVLVVCGSTCEKCAEESPRVPLSMAVVLPIQGCHALVPLWKWHCTIVATMMIQ